MNESKLNKKTSSGKQMKVKLSLFLYDAVIFLLVDVLLLVLYRGGGNLSFRGVLPFHAR